MTRLVVTTQPLSTTRHGMLLHLTMQQQLQVACLGCSSCLAI
jgi:hypothetical protein